MGLMGGGRRPGAGQPEADRPGLDQPTEAEAYAPGPTGLVERVVVTLSGVRQPIVAILLLISLFTVLSGKPLDGLLLSIVATALAWDAGLRAREARASAGQRAPSGGADVSDPQSAWRLRTGRPATR